MARSEWQGLITLKNLILPLELATYLNVCRRKQELHARDRSKGLLKEADPFRGLVSKDHRHCCMLQVFLRHNEHIEVLGWVPGRLRSRAPEKHGLQGAGSSAVWMTKNQVEHCIPVCIHVKRGLGSSARIKKHSKGTILSLQGTRRGRCSIGLCNMGAAFCSQCSILARGILR